MWDEAHLGVAPARAACPCAVALKRRDGAAATATRFSWRKREKRVEGALPALLQPALSMTNAARMEGCSIATSATRSRERDACIAAIEVARCVRPIACKKRRIGPCRLRRPAAGRALAPCPVLPRKLSARGRHFIRVVSGRGVPSGRGRNPTLNFISHQKIQKIMAANSLEFQWNWTPDTPNRTEPVGCSGPGLRVLLLGPLTYINQTELSQ